MRRLVAIAACTILASCGGVAFERPVPPDQEQSVIYIYRLSKAVGAANDAPMYIDDASVGDLESGGFIRVPVAPGRHVVQVKTAFFYWGPTRTVELDVDRGQIAYVRYNISSRLKPFGTPTVPVVADISSSVEVIEPQVALLELVGLRESD